jgi:hypothetical protein
MQMKIGLLLSIQFSSCSGEKYFSLASKYEGVTVSELQCSKRDAQYEIGAVHCRRSSFEAGVLDEDDYRSWTLEVLEINNRSFPTSF